MNSGWTKYLSKTLKLPDWLQACPAADYPATCALVWSVERSWRELPFGRLLTLPPNRLQQNRAESWKTATCHHYRRTKDLLNIAAAAITTYSKCLDLLWEASPLSVRRILFPEPRGGCFTPAEFHTFQSSLVTIQLELFLLFWYWDLPWLNQRSFCRSATVIRSFGLASNSLDNKPIKRV